MVYAVGSGGGGGLNYDRGSLQYLLSWSFNWAGFKATGRDLHYEGWTATEVRHHARFASYLILENQQQKAVMCSSVVDDLYMKDAYHNVSYRGGLLSLGLRTCTRDVIFETAGPAPIFEAISLEPAFISQYDMARYHYSHESPFKKLISTVSQNIIIPDEPDVNTLLEQILNKQQPEQIKYFEEKVKQNQIPEARMMGQIIQMRAA